MYCPECGGEYRKGFTHCADCDVDLVEALPMKTPLPDVGLVTVLETGDPSELVFAESVLQQAGIPFVKKGDSLQELFALGRLGTGFNPIAGPVVLLVSEDQAEAAAQLLEEPMPDEADRPAEWDQDAEPD
jgi:hypothetical protein